MNLKINVEDKVCLALLKEIDQKTNGKGYSLTIRSLDAGCTFWESRFEAENNVDIVTETPGTEPLLWNLREFLGALKDYFLGKLPKPEVSTNAFCCLSEINLKKAVAREKDVKTPRLFLFSASILPTKGKSIYAVFEDGSVHEGIRFSEDTFIASSNQFKGTVFIWADSVKLWHYKD